MQTLNLFQKEKTKKEPFIEFDVKAWNAFAKFINKTKTSQNKLYIQYKYLNVKYEYIIFKFLQKNDKFIGIEFWVPDHPESTLSCRLINRVSNVAEAINFIYELNQNSFAG